MAARGKTGEPSRTAYEVVHVRTWSQFQSLLRKPKYKNWAFRGQADADWLLESSLTRYLKSFGLHPKAWTRQEWRIVRIFRRKAHLFLDHVPAEDDIFQWLLDFTWSPFVAAFFALERATRNAAVWALCVAELRSYRDHLPNEKLATAKWGLRQPGNYEKHFLRATVPFVAVGEPYVMNKRLVAQSGTFVAPSLVDRPIEEILALYPRPAATLAKFVLDTERLRDEAMEALYNMNLTHATLFPDLDGLARSMAYELEFHWAFNPKTMEEYRGFEGYVDERKSRS